MNNLPSEYSILMLKPDCVEKGLVSEIVQMVQAAHLQIVRCKEVQLTTSDILQYFLHPTSEYIKFLTRSPVLMYLVYGHNPHETLYNLKKSIRALYGLQGKKQNLIHTVDQGNEYHLFLRRFFSELDPLSYCNSIDHDLCLFNINDQDTLTQLLVELDSSSMLRECTLRLVNETQIDWLPHLQQLRLKRLQLHFCTQIDLIDCARRCTLLVSSPESASAWQCLWAKLHGTCTKADLSKIREEWHASLSVNDFPISEIELQEYRWLIEHQPDQLDEKLLHTRPYLDLQDIMRGGIEGVMCFRPDFSLLETEYRMDLCRLFHCQERGGSSAKVAPGYFSVSISCCTST